MPASCASVPDPVDAAAARLFRTFHTHPADRVVIRRHPRLVPPVVSRLGSLQGIIYRSDKGTPGRERNFIHFLTDPPELVCDPTGTRLFIVGGSYRVTGRGIEG